MEFLRDFRARLFAKNLFAGDPAVGVDEVDPVFDDFQTRRRVISRVVKEEQFSCLGT